MIATKFKSSASRLVALTIVKDTDDIMMVTANGIVTRINAGSISRQGRPATGVKAINLVDNDMVCSVNKILNPDEDEEFQGTAENATPETNVEQGSLLDNNEE